MTQEARADILTGLDDDQLRAATTLLGPLAIIAGAGSGKTRVITHRIAYGVLEGVFDPSTTVAVTFTTKAAGEMTRRLRSLGVPGVRVRTFHAAALRQLRYYWQRTGRGELPQLTAAKAPLVAGAASVLGVSNVAAAVRDYAAEIEWAKVRCLTPQQYPAAAAAAGRASVGDLSAEQMGTLFDIYEHRKSAAGRMDFEDVLLLMVALLDHEPRVAAHLRPGISHVTVDEYQDVSPLQQRLLDGWLGSNTNLCVVGDPAQTIYTFAGADAGFLTGFSARYPDAATVNLVSTYRCSPQVTELANRVLAQSPAPRRMVSRQSSGPEVRIRSFEDPQSEAQGVVEAIAQLVGAGFDPAEIAVLVRINAMTEPFEDALSAAGIGYQVTGSSGYFSRPEVRKAISLIRGAAVAADDAAGSVSQAVSALLSGMGWNPSAPPAGTGAMRSEWESLAALHAAAETFDAEHEAALLADFAAELHDRAERQDAPDSTGVTLATLHAAKGAEWRAVFLPGLSEGLLPHASAKQAAQVEEERRLLYVGVTRAAEVLQLSYASSGAARGRSRRVSRFLADLDATLGSSGAPAPKRRRKRTVARCRTCAKGLVTGAERTLGRCHSCAPEIDLALLERLQQWRREAVERASKERGSPLPAYLIATDATLQAIAEQRPLDLSALAQIPGIGPRRIDEFGPALLGVVHGD